MSQPTSTQATTPVSAGLAKHIGRVVEDASLNYSGGLAKLELVKGDPDFVVELYKLFDARAAKRAETLAIMDRPVWKTVNLGTHESYKDLRKALAGASVNIGSCGDDILKRITVATEPTTLDLVLVTVADLGFPNGAKRSEICAKALSLGLQLCPAEVGPQLRLQYPDQPNGEWVLVAMEPITDSDGNLTVFCVERDDGGRLLSGFPAYPGSFWLGGTRWVFARK